VKKQELYILALLATLACNPVHAEEAKVVAEPTTAAPAVQPEEQDISKLADDYWRPGEDELGVIQDRRYNKEKRVEATLLYGFYQGGGYSDTKATGIALTYHWSNRWATEISTLRLSHQKSDFLTAVENQYGFTPDFNREVSQHTVAMVWTPIYAKFALLGKKVSHFETYIAPGLGLTKTLSNHLTGHLSIGEKFFITEHMILRLEWKMSRYTDSIRASTGAYSTSNGGPGFYKQTDTVHNLLFGLGWLF
jgi:outer membrane beta-barrel protein